MGVYRPFSEQLIFFTMNSDFRRGAWRVLGRCHGDPLPTAESRETRAVELSSKTVPATLPGGAELMESETSPGIL